MVTINATMLVELLLFLLFLWGTQRYILAPVLKNIDEREDSIEQDRAQTEADTTAAQALEKKYRHEIAVIRRNADEQVRAAQQKSQQEHAAFLTDERARAEQSIDEVRKDAQHLVDTEQDSVDAQIPELTKQIEAMLTRRGGA
jgi:F-type H+-transporting ATPase subunit b